MIKRIVILLSLCLILTGCGGNRSIEPFEGRWKESITGLVLTLNPDGVYTMTDDEGTEMGTVTHDRGDWFIFKIVNGQHIGVENKFKLTLEGEQLSLEIADGTALKFDRLP